MRLAKIGWTPDNLFFRGVKLAFVNTQAWRNWEDTMRSLKLALAGVCALGLLSAGTANSAEPVKIRMSWVAPIANWGSIVLEKKDLAQHLGKSYTLESIHYQGTPHDHGDRQQRAGGRQPGLFLARHRHRKRRARRHPRHCR